MPKVLREYQPYAKGPGSGRWFEEDCDWSIVALAFPEYFGAKDISQARDILKNYKPELYEQLIAEKAGTTPPKTGGRGL